jgi:hypothetical protein
MCRIRHSASCREDNRMVAGGINQQQQGVSWRATASGFTLVQYTNAQILNCSVNAALPEIVC